ncbi:DUF488 domain-containing protein [Tepidiforma bonchosmolovskayae]|uniref:DUF488 domain-containing protein n=2 Tax=Tepidiformaceae TaxID=2682227 RepID=A0ABX6C158_9CHLR|nr:DUF488 domain-containing protein [Tepidiforma bonchosmolovskayae]
MRVMTIGFTKKSARQFFETIGQAEARRLVDVRLNNASQLAGFTRRDDLEYFLGAILGIGYVHEPLLAPTPELLTGYRNEKRPWSWYEEEFLRLMRERRIDERVPRELIDGAVLLCSEATADRCHRRLVAEYLAARWGGMEIVHLP